MSKVYLKVICGDCRLWMQGTVEYENDDAEELIKKIEDRLILHPSGYCRKASKAKKATPHPVTKFSSV